VVHNTFYDNGKTTSNWGGVATQDDVSVVNNNLFKNNIVANTAGPLEWANGDKDSFSVVDYNIYVNASRPLAFQWGSTTYNFANYKSASRLDANSLASDPLMTNPAGGDFTLRAGSPAIDRGDFLTRTTAAGSGTTIPVSSARYFSDGFGLVPGDLIQLEGQTQTARVLAVRLDSNAITVDRSLSWTSGVGVSYAFAGSKPDIGFSEVGLTP
jgi:hypothetical protein